MASAANRFSKLVSCMAAAAILQTAAPASFSQQPRPSSKSPAAAKGSGKAETAGPSPAMSEKRAKDPTKDLQVVAVVNNLQITRQKLADECVRRYGKEVLDARIHKQLIFSECQAQDITITEAQVNDEISRIAEKFRIPVDKYVELIQNERDVSIDQYKKDIIWPQLALRELADKEMEVGPAEIEKAWDTDFGPKVKCSVIVCRTKEDALKVRAKCLADPEEFGTIAKNESVDRQSAAVMGSIPPIAKNVHDPRVEKIAFGLEPGEISEVIPLSEMKQFLILKCEKQIPQVYVPKEHIEDAKQRIVDRLRDGKSMAVAAKICEKLEKKAKVRTIYNDKKLAEEEPGVVATINGAPVTRQMLAEDCISRFGKQVLEGEINRTMLEGALKARKVAVSDEMINDEMTQAAKTAQIFKADGKTPDVDAWLKAAAEEWSITPELYISDYVWNTCAMKLLAPSDYEVTEEELKKAFEANYGPRARVLAIVGSDERRMKDVWNMAMQDPKQSTFGQLAAQYSEETVSRSNLGLIPPIPRYSGRQKLEDAAFKLKKNEISAVIQADSTYYVILFGLGLTESIVPKMDAAIRKELTTVIIDGKRTAAMTKAYDDLRESADIVNLLTGETQSGNRVATKPKEGSKGAAPRAGSKTKE